MSISYSALESQTLSGLGVPLPNFNGDSSFYGATVFVYTILFIGIGIAGFYGVLQGSIWRMQASEEKIRMSNEKFKKVTLGLLGTFGMFLLLVTLNKDLLTGDIGLAALKASPVSGGAIPTTGVGSGGATSSTTPPTGSTNYQARKASHDNIVGRLAPSGIHTNHGDTACTEAQFQQSTPSCTSLSYLPEESIQMLLSLNSMCNCSLVISGGTEPGHSSHGENRRPVDLQKNDALYNFIRNNGNGGLETGGCYTSYVWHGFTFCDEKPRGNSTWAPHFHVS